MVSVAFKQNLKKKYGIKFNNEKLLEDAFTHSSYANEHPGRKDYEKLEFLGDAVLELAVSDYLYRHFPRLNEGELTRMRSNIVEQKDFLNLPLNVDFQKKLIWVKEKKKLALGNGRHFLKMCLKLSMVHFS